MSNLSFGTQVLDVWAERNLLRKQLQECKAINEGVLNRVTALESQLKESEELVGRYAQYAKAQDELIACLGRTVAGLAGKVVQDMGRMGSLSDANFALAGQLEESHLRIAELQRKEV